jgi:hypothetical protein
MNAWERQRRQRSWSSAIDDWRRSARPPQSPTPDRQSPIRRPLGRLIGFSAAALLSALALAQGTPATDAPTAVPRAWPIYTVPGEPDLCTLYYDGSQVVAETEAEWKLVCGSNPAGVTVADLKDWAERHEALMREGPVTIVAAPNRSRTSINIVFHATGAPPEAVAALAVGAAYLDSLFSDPITIDIGITFQNLGDPNILGSTSVNYNLNQSYTNTRNGLVSGMHCYDVIQDWLPSGSYCPVRYNGNSDTITNQSTISWPKGAYLATMGTTAGYAGSTTFNTQCAWDFDPTDGVPGGVFSFLDVLIHETGHALGFVSAADLMSPTMYVLDLYRFQRTDGSYDYNPDTYEEFQIRPRLVDYNTPDDDHNSDLIAAEYRMSDGDPAQASHFRDQAPRIGLMGPYIADGQTFYPNYYTTADIAMFDAIGYDYPPCECPLFLQQPQDVLGCAGTTVELSVAVNLTNPGYQWRISGNPLPENGHFVGTQTATLQIVDLTIDDGSDLYNCLVTNLTDGCEHSSDNASVAVNSPVTITDPPDSATILEGGTINMHVEATGQAPLTYQWRHDGVDLVNSGNTFGVTTATMTIVNTLASQAGYYDCRVTNPCGPVISPAAHLQVNTGAGAWRGDMNCDVAVGFGDINPFVLAISAGETGYYALYPDCHYYNGDINQDGSVNFGDINPFVECIVEGGCP